jgi:hypothetical protein
MGEKNVCGETRLRFMGIDSRLEYEWRFGFEFEVEIDEESRK